MPNKLTGFKAVITGGSDGLGLAMAQALLAEGATVALAARPSAKLVKAVSTLQQEGMDAHALPLDVRSEQSVTEAVAWVKEQWGQVDLLVNNAGIGMGRVNPKFSTEPQPFFTASAAGFRDVVETNFTGYFLVAKGFVPMMIEQGKGRIVNVSTSLQTMTRKGMSPYGPARAGAEALSQIMTAELKEHGISVNLLLPGGAADTGLIPEELREEFRKRPNLLQPD
ncbi:MAG: SDR family oxidoreductase, partial [Firmicutes bacterium]|nr:SDR family oxidoreductase [Bacillota bacterium]